jgi:acetolactate synthase-1/2/3 large subunit
VSDDRFTNPPDTHVTSTPSVLTNAEAYLAQLARRGIDHVFANAGTDFAPIIEALSGQSADVKYPRFVTVPHENLAMSMAYGYYRATGKMAGVMVHVSVGTANALCGLMNAARDNIPILLAAGRTPVTETGNIASRERQIHWGQECRDQGQIVREFVKWDYELKHGQPVDTIVDRALDIAMSEPRGPVYLTLPREVLAGEAKVSGRGRTGHPTGVSAGAPGPEAIAEAARLIASAAFPLIITTSAGIMPDGFHALSSFANACAIPVIQPDAYANNLPSGHPMNLGFEATADIVGAADVVLVIDTKVPWQPRTLTPRKDAKLIHLAPDPLMTMVPFHGFVWDLALSGSSAVSLPLLQAAVLSAQSGKEEQREARRQKIGAMRAAAVAAQAKVLEAARSKKPLVGQHIAAVISELKAAGAIVVSELGIAPKFLSLDEPCSFMANAIAGGLGLGLGCALGAKLGAPHREVITTVGDGSYMFGNPLPYHWVQRTEKLPILTIVTNNQMWYAVQRSTLSVYPKGHASATNQMPLVALEPSPAFEKMVETCGGFGAKVEEPDQLRPVLKQAFEAIRSGTPALINMITQGRS